MGRLNFTYGTDEKFPFPNKRLVVFGKTENEGAQKIASLFNVPTVRYSFCYTEEEFDKLKESKNLALAGYVFCNDLDGLQDVLVKELKYGAEIRVFTKTLGTLKSDYIGFGSGKMKLGGIYNGIEKIPFEEIEAIIFS